MEPSFKPAPAVYLAAVEAFNLKPGECLMCAAHSGDLKAAAGNGLRNMRERAAAMGGALQMTSSAGKGTRLRVTFPVDGVRP